MSAEMKPGYKQTEVGVIPEDWDVAPMGELFNISGGLSASRDQLGENGHCYLHYGDIHTSSRTYIDVDKQRVDIPKLDVHLGDVPKKSILLDGDIVFVDASEDDDGTSKHQVVCNPRGISFISGLHTIVAKSKRETFANSYKRHCFQTRSIKDQFRFYAVGTKVSGISKTNIAKILLPIPPLSEQTAIAEALNHVDALIESLEQLIAKKRHIKQGAMQELLTGKKRLPGFSGEWEVKRFGDVVAPRNERIDPRKTVPQEFCVELEHIGSASGSILGSTATGSHSSLKSVFRPGDVLFGKLRAYLRKYWLADRLGVCSTEIWVLSVRDSLIPNSYLFQVVQTDAFIDAASSCYGTHMPRSDWNVVRNYELTLPPTTAEQTAIAAILSDMDTEIAAMEAKLAKARQIKQGMMQELLTGKTRLV